MRRDVGHRPGEVLHLVITWHCLLAQNALSLQFLRLIRLNRATALNISQNLSKGERQNVNLKWSWSQSIKTTTFRQWIRNKPKAKASYMGLLPVDRSGQVTEGRGCGWWDRFSLTPRHPETFLLPLPHCCLGGSFASFWSPWLVRGSFVSVLQAQSKREGEDKNIREEAVEVDRGNKGDR